MSAPVGTDAWRHLQWLSRKVGSFVVSGVVGGYEEYLSRRDVSYVAKRIAALMPRALGYRVPGVPPAAVSR